MAVGVAQAGRAFPAEEEQPEENRMGWVPSGQESSAF